MNGVYWLQIPQGRNVPDPGKYYDPSRTNADRPFQPEIVITLLVFILTLVVVARLLRWKSRRF